MRSNGVVLLSLLLTAPVAALAQSTIEPATEGLAALVRSYPEFLDRIEGNELLWKDGTRMRVDDGKGPKAFKAMLEDPDIKDMFLMHYPLGENGVPPEIDFDPGRVRYLPLFNKVYGDCRNAGFMANAIDVTWLPSKYGKKIKFTRINGAAAELQKVSNELDRMPARFLDYLRPTQGTYNCRVIAGTSHPGPHSFGIAIDIAAAHSHYWLWSKPDANGGYRYKNEIPWEIVNIFEKHGFIWGGKWYHYDTMHFEYRPEIIGAAK